MYVCEDASNKIKITLPVSRSFNTSFIPLSYSSVVSLDCVCWKGLMQAFFSSGLCVVTASVGFCTFKSILLDAEKIRGIRELTKRR